MGSRMALVAPVDSWGSFERSRAPAWVTANLKPCVSGVQSRSKLHAHLNNLRALGTRMCPLEGAMADCYNRM